MTAKFEQWFINQDFYTNMRFIHGDTLFLKDGDVYRVLPVQMTYSAWVYRQGRIAQGGVFMGVEYNSLRGTDEFFDALQEKLENRP